MTDQYRHIRNVSDYNSLLNSGMFWEFHPELSGDWQKDKTTIGIKEPESETTSIKQENIIMKYAFVVFDFDDSIPHGWEFVGIFVTEQEADQACINQRYMMACVTVGKAIHEKSVKVWEFGFKFPRYDEIEPTWDYGDNAYRLPDDLIIGTK